VSCHIDFGGVVHLGPAPKDKEQFTSEDEEKTST
jgi:hypothetical protein